MSHMYEGLTMAEKFLPLRYEDGPDYCTVKDAQGRDFALTVQPKLLQKLEQAIGENARLRELIGRPYIGAWADEIIVEAAHQRDRWGADHDHGKQPEDWFWLVGYLAGKCLAAYKAGDQSKARHHTVSTAAVLAHWAAAIDGNEGVFRPASGAEALQHTLPGHDETMANLDALTVRPQPKTPHVLKLGNLFNHIPDDVSYSGCADKDCVPGCNIGKGHCQRLEDAFRMAGYADATD